MTRAVGHMLGGRPGLDAAAQDVPRHEVAVLARGVHCAAVGVEGHVSGGWHQAEGRAHGLARCQVPQEDGALLSVGRQLSPVGAQRETAHRPPSAVQGSGDGWLVQQRGQQAALCFRGGGDLGSLVGQQEGQATIAVEVHEGLRGRLAGKGDRGLLHGAVPLGGGLVPLARGLPLLGQRVDRDEGQGQHDRRRDRDDSLPELRACSHAGLHECQFGAVDPLRICRRVGLRRQHLPRPTHAPTQPLLLAARRPQRLLHLRQAGIVVPQQAGFGFRPAPCSTRWPPAPAGAARAGTPRLPSSSAAACPRPAPARRAPARRRLRLSCRRDYPRCRAPAGGHPPAGRARS